ncbi:hypothetical protein mRhiFer1_009685 [Rhinolophus ferrumequinum]|uniref:Uncharacterized protein n=1 Tax=Rhinolophus ferrumequinum TaxID=59479 RepID=A0A7J7R1M2_RHIFE|nr:hypothetical protein mRhiFer1_009685 [Rhinolophus ferrumequinum]
MILVKEQLEKPQGLNSRPGVALTHSEKLQGVFSALLSGQCEGSDSRTGKATLSNSQPLPSQTPSQTPSNWVACVTVLAKETKAEVSGASGGDVPLLISGDAELYSSFSTSSCLECGCQEGRHCTFMLDEGAILKPNWP